MNLSSSNPSKEQKDTREEFCVRCATVVIRAQIQKKNAQIVFFHVQVKMLSFKNMLRLRCSDRNKCSDENAQLKKNAQLEM